MFVTQMLECIPSGIFCTKPLDNEETFWVETPKKGVTMEIECKKKTKRNL